MAFVAEQTRHRGRARSRSSSARSRRSRDAGAVRQLAELIRAGAPARPPHAHRQGGRGRARRGPARRASAAAGRRPHVPRPHAARATSARRSRSALPADRARARARDRCARSPSAPRSATSSSRSASRRRRSFAVVRLGIELSERMEGAEQGDELRASLGIPPERFTIGWVGRMTAVKRAHDVLRTLSLLHDRGIDAALVMVGDGPDRPELEALATRARHRAGDPLRRLPGRRRAVVPRLRRAAPALAQRGHAGQRDRDARRRPAGRRVARRRRPGRRRRRHRRLPLSRRRRRRGRRAPRAPRRRSRAPPPDGRAGPRAGAGRYRVPRLVEDVDRLYRALLAAKGLPVAAGGRAPTVNE